MKKLFYPVILVLLLIICPHYHSVRCQNKFANKKIVPTDIINPDNYSMQVMRGCVLSEVNNYRRSKSLDTLLTNKVLEHASEDQALFMAKKKTATLVNAGKKKTTVGRVRFYGGTGNVDEVVGKDPLNKGDDYFTYQKVAEDIVAYWVKNKRYESILTDPGYIFAGISGSIDNEGKKIYISVVLGNYTSLSSSVADRKKMPNPYTMHSYGLKLFDKKICRKCLKYTSEIEQLRQGLIVRDGKIYLKTNDIKIIKKLMKNPKDGIAIDIVQKEQYPCEGNNIVDFNLVNKGVLLKPVMSSTLLKLNTIKDKKSKAYEGCLGKLPKYIKGDYELNMMIIQNRSVCRSVTQSYNDIQKTRINAPVKLMYDFSTSKMDSDYKPKPESSLLTFVVPFEKNKYTYKQSDIEPFINKLNEPDFTINEIDIAAYSSIEGDATYNDKLQNQRANSILEALKARQKSAIKTNVTTDSTWDEFCNDVKGTKYEQLSTMSMQDANRYIIDHNLQKELEPILAKHRFAKIVMDITYDIRGPKEQDFVLSKFNKTVKAGDIPLALSIQKYIVHCVLVRKYTAKAITDMVIPDDKINNILINNKLVLQLMASETLPSDENFKTFATLLKNDPKNIFIYHNNLYCTLLNVEMTNVTQVNDMQAKIDDLYTNSKLPVENIDNLNLELQFSTLRMLDSIDVPKDVLNKAFDKIKSIVKIEETDWESALKLANMFITHNDFEYSGKLMDAYLDQDVSEEYLFTYISLCSHSQARIMSNKFASAALRAYKVNPTRFCSLFKGDKFSFQIFDNPKVKEIYCKNCTK